MAASLDPSTLSFRPCTRADFPLLHRWFHAPHAAQWFAKRGETLEVVSAEYARYVDGVEPIHVYIASIDAVIRRRRTRSRSGRTRRPGSGSRVT